MLALLLATASFAASKPIVLVTGATGRTGSMIYGLLKADDGYEVRSTMPAGTHASNAECASRFRCARW